uniref:NR LBD domain-containing protein n=1 Tax=Caenorhabditis tropicalis TaxID=1561998 RepID=A0A1I7U0P0_9PELO
MGMFFGPKPDIKGLETRSGTELNKIIIELKRRDNARFLNLFNYYSVEDPSLEEVLIDSSCMNLKAKTSNVYISPHEWAFLDVLSRITYFSQFSFMEGLTLQDKKILFSHNILRVGLLAGGMRTMQEKRDKMLTPSGEDVYPDVVHRLFKNSSGILNSICTRVVGRLIELQVTREEYLLLTLIFFCDPGNSFDFSREASFVYSYFPFAVIVRKIKASFMEK